MDGSGQMPVPGGGQGVPMPKYCASAELLTPSSWWSNDVVEVAGPKDELLAEDVLVDTDVVGARALRSLRKDVILADVRDVAGLEKLRVEAVELEPECRLLHAGRVVGAKARAVEELRRGPDRNVVKPMRGVPAMP